MCLPQFDQLAAVGHRRITLYENPLQHIEKFMLINIFSMSSDVRGVVGIQVAWFEVAEVAKTVVGQKQHHNTISKVYYYGSIQA